MTTRDDLIEATRELMWERGYGATSPREILDAAGAGKGSMYHHFQGKEALAQAAIERNTEQMRAQVEADLHSAGSATARIRAYLSRDHEVVLKGCQFGRLVQEPEVIEAPALRGEVEGMFAWIRGQLAAVISSGVESGEFRPDLDPARTAAAVAATLQGGYVLARAAQDASVFDDAVEGVLALLEAARA
ncbi:TetR family transcriptional regulator [Leifsonia sp. NPDC077715]|uniref:TetR family transcriptional regulator n=1 Tax=Leifsonia sp. NPDC077715 TaxID=3155539 RepID=UPI00341456A0